MSVRAWFPIRQQPLTPRLCSSQHGCRSRGVWGSRHRVALTLEALAACPPVGVTTDQQGCMRQWSRLGRLNVEELLTGPVLPQQPLRWASGHCSAGAQRNPESTNPENRRLHPVSLVCEHPPGAHCPRALPGKWVSHIHHTQLSGPHVLPDTPPWLRGHPPQPRPGA